MAGMRDWRLEHFRSLQALSRTGLHFCRDEYDRERYAAIERIASELLAAGAGIDPTALRAEWSREGGYVTPKVEVRGAAFRPADGKVLLVRETMDGLWTLPGGWGPGTVGLGALNNFPSLPGDDDLYWVRVENQRCALTWSRGDGYNTDRIVTFQSIEVIE